ncbi:MAG: Spermidine/putrescine import ATP-binding protein PotA [Candidatus Moanabacter tarae]|uniref:Spermidine/putrescine import ATP-binding protein PotA n=1 Tax=Candidatus Moanibacter tarae TaxID=2200854 RepID=A0A2Z4APR4_9BACT|nr:MAG: Spermidine/putrescine import ATP-binding protein PotA [Candidatus Moanabacter tarae]|tara:strand:- start:4111 stop:5217 length:1107 start_codon:yes stop_codon:yes gene_type:complete
MKHLNLLKVDLSLPLDLFTLRASFTTSKKVTGIFGISGSGKSTLLEAVAGLRRKASGRIQFGEEIWQNSLTGLFVKPENRGIGYVPQDSLLFPHMDVETNLLAGASRARHNGSHWGTTHDTILKVLHLSPLLKRRVNSLSGGEIQRVALGRALCSGPQMLLLDEPLASLDLALRYKILPFLQTICEKFQLPVLIVSHDPIEVQALCDDLIVLREGKVIGRGEPKSVLTKPEIFPMAKNEGFQNIFKGRINKLYRETATIRIGEMNSSVEFITPAAIGHVGDPILLRISSNDIMIATTKPKNLSARNVIPAVVEGIQTIRNSRIISARMAENVSPIIVELTTDSIKKLKICVGFQIFLIIKTTSFSLYQ